MSHTEAEGREMAEDTRVTPIGARLRAEREKQLRSRPEISARSGVPVPTIEGIELGKVARPRRRTIDKLAKALDVDVEALMYGPEGDDDPLGAAAPPSPDDMRAADDDALRYFLAAVEAKLASHDLATDPDELLFVHAAVFALGWERVSQLPGDLSYRVVAVAKALNDLGEGYVNFKDEVRNLEAEQQRIEEAEEAG
jgi:transcriptional regulator with XRE-family HTH domain